MRTSRRRLSALVVMVLAAVSLLTPRTGAQTGNQSTKIVDTETFEFPNECTNELMNVTTTSTVTCHDQSRSDGSFREKCEIHENVTAVGQTSGITFHGTDTFKDEFVTSDPCNFTFTNHGTVHLISQGSAVNAVVTFDDVVAMQNCVILPEQHVVSFDCRGSGN